jgi:hypothetical protein
MKAPKIRTQFVEPQAILYRENGKQMCAIHPPEGWTYEHYGMIICDLIRNTAMAFDVDERDVFEWIEKERRNPTSPIVQWTVDTRQRTGT